MVKHPEILTLQVRNVFSHDLMSVITTVSECIDALARKLSGAELRTLAEN